MLYHWKRQKSKENIIFSIPTIWRNPDSTEECYFWLNEIKGFNIKNKKKIVYIDAASITIPVLVDQNKRETDIGHVFGCIESMEVFEESAEENESLSDNNDTSELKYTSCYKKCSSIIGVTVGVKRSCWRLRFTKRWFRGLGFISQKEKSFTT